MKCVKNRVKVWIIRCRTGQASPGQLTITSPHTNDMMRTVLKRGSSAWNVHPNNIRQNWFSFKKLQKHKLSNLLKTLLVSQLFWYFFTFYLFFWFIYRLLLLVVLYAVISSVFWSLCLAHTAFFHLIDTCDFNLYFLLDPRKTRITLWNLMGVQ